MVIIPVQAHYLSLKGLELLLQSITRVQKHINPGLKIDGILPTMVDARTNHAKEIITLLNDTYGGKLNIYHEQIPLSVRVAETSAIGKSIYLHDPRMKAAIAYEALTMEVLSHEI